MQNCTICDSLLRLWGIQVGYGWGPCEGVGRHGGAIPISVVGGGFNPPTLGYCRREIPVAEHIANPRRINRRRHPLPNGPPGHPMGPCLLIGRDGFNLNLGIAHRAWRKNEMRSRQINNDSGPKEGDWICAALLAEHRPEWGEWDWRSRCGHRNWRRNAICKRCYDLGERPVRRDGNDPRGDTRVGARTFGPRVVRR